MKSQQYAIIASLCSKLMLSNANSTAVQIEHNSREPQGKLRESYVGHSGALQMCHWHGIAEYRSVSSLATYIITRSINYCHAAFILLPRHKHSLLLGLFVASQ